MACVIAERHSHSALRVGAASGCGRLMGARENAGTTSQDDAEDEEDGASSVEGD